MESSQNSAPAPIDLISILSRFWKQLKRIWILVLVLTMLLSGLNLIRAARSYSPVYECKAIFSVASGYATDDIFTSSYYYDSATAQSMASTFPYLLSTDFMRDLIIEQLDKNYINGTISVSAFSGTNMLEIRVKSSSAQDAYDILGAVIACYPQAAVYMVDNPLIYVREEPVVPTTPTNPFSVNGPMIKGAVMGLILGLGIAAVMALMNRSVTTPSELKKVVNLPVLATLPLVSVKKRRKNVRTFITSADDAGVAEALRGLRTKIRKELDEKEGKVVLLTSTIPGEGKTTISANLALSLAAEGHRVVLVDADLRNQTVGRIFGGGQKRAGLMECMRNPNQPIGECLKQVSGSTLYYLSGSSTQKRHYSIEAKGIRRVLDALSQNFDYVVVDTPPCSVVSDTALLSRYADCVLYVVKMDYASQGQILDGITSLHQREVPLTGCVINGAEVKRSHYGYGYGYGYGKKYGYGQSKKSSGSGK